LGKRGFTLLLYLLSEHGNNINLLKQTTDFLIKYTVRRNLTDFPNTRDLDRLFIGLIDECEKNRETLSFRVIEEYLTYPTRFSDNETFEKRLKGDIYQENAPVARFLLCKIEESHQTRENRKDLWEKNNKGSFVWTVEHILPEGENIPESWIDMIAEGDVQRAKELQNRFVHKLGNLTLTAYNSNLSNLSFERKQNLTDRNGNNIGYKNGLYLNRELSIKDSWKISDIEQRTEKLVQEVLNMYL